MFITRLINISCRIMVNFVKKVFLTMISMESTSGLHSIIASAPRRPHVLLLMARVSVIWNSSPICIEELTTLLTHVKKTPLFSHVRKAIHNANVLLDDDPLILTIILVRPKAPCCTLWPPRCSSSRCVCPWEALHWGAFAFPMKCVARLIPLVTLPPVSPWEVLPVA